jgi:hypothetical protein
MTAHRSVSPNDSADALAGAVGAGSQDSNNDTRSLPQSGSPYATRRRFLILAAMAGWVQPERVTERILAELADEASQ